MWEHIGKQSWDIESKPHPQLVQLGKERKAHSDAKDVRYNSVRGSKIHEHHRHAPHAIDVLIQQSYVDQKYKDAVPWRLRGGTKTAFRYGL